MTTICWIRTKAYNEAECQIQTHNQYQDWGIRLSIQKDEKRGWKEYKRDLQNYFRRRKFAVIEKFSIIFLQSSNSISSMTYWCALAFLRNSCWQYMIDNVNLIFRLIFVWPVFVDDIEFLLRKMFSLQKADTGLWICIFQIRLFS